MKNQTVTLPVSYQGQRNPHLLRGVKRRTNCSHVFLNP